MNSDLFVHLLDMPTTVKEAITQNPDGSYTVILNSRLSRETQFNAFVHAVEHIKGNDFEKEDVQSIEFDAHMRGGMQCRQQRN